MPSGHGQKRASFFGWLTLKGEKVLFKKRRPWAAGSSTFPSSGQWAGRLRLLLGEGRASPRRRGRRSRRWPTCPRPWPGTRGSGGPSGLAVDRPLPKSGQLLGLFLGGGLSGKPNLMSQKVKKSWLVEGFRTCWAWVSGQGRFGVWFGVGSGWVYVRVSAWLRLYLS